jgi:hypothetical protein
MGPGLFSWIASSTEKAEVFKYYHTSLQNSLNKIQKRFQCTIAPGMLGLLIELIQADSRQCRDHARPGPKNAMVAQIAR